MRFSALSLALLAMTFLPLGCRAQSPVPGQPLSPALARRVEVLLRQKANLPPGSTVTVGTPSASELPGYSTIPVAVVSEGNTSRPINFLLSADGKTLAQFSKFDISADPRDLISTSDRPARGGAANAPVVVVGYDDLECPFCARSHAALFPLLTEHYGDKVRFVYKDFPLTQIHPWAMRAAVDVNCLGAQSAAGYWNALDYIHAHASEIGQAPGVDSKDNGPKDSGSKDKTLARANEQLDKITREQGTFQKLDMPKLDVCLTKQDTKAIDAMADEGTKLGVAGTPTLFVNGDKIDFTSPEFVFTVIDNALRAEGVTPPPPYVAPAAPAATDKPAAAKAIAPSL